jgi:hypothetical protein
MTSGEGTDASAMVAGAWADAYGLVATKPAGMSFARLLDQSGIEFVYADAALLRDPSWHEVLAPGNGRWTVTEQGADWALYQRAGP